MPTAVGNPSLGSHTSLLPFALLPAGPSLDAPAAPAVYDPAETVSLPAAALFLPALSQLSLPAPLPAKTGPAFSSQEPVRNESRTAFGRLSAPVPFSAPEPGDIQAQKDFGGRSFAFKLGEPDGGDPVPSGASSSGGPGVEDAAALATIRHHGQKDHAGKPYIGHPLRVMAKMRTSEARMAAVLHDIIEDTETTLEELRQLGYPEAVVQAVDRLTHRAGESYDDYIDRVGSDPLAREVKLADLEDNMDLGRIAKPTKTDLQRLAKYRKAWERLNRLGRG